MAADMFDVQLFRYDQKGRSVRLTQVKSYVDGKPAPLDDRKIDVELGIEHPSRDFALMKTISFLRQRLVGPRCVRKSFALLLDAAGIAAVEEWPAYGLATLASLQGASLATPPSDFFRSSDGEGGRPINLDGRPCRGMLGYLRRDGTLDVVTVLPTLSQRYRDADGWMVIAPEVRSHLSCAAPDAMMACLDYQISAIDIQNELQRLFWQLVAPSLSDPFVRQQRHWLGQPQSWSPRLEDDPVEIYVQPRPEIAFARGSGEILKQILADSLALVVGGDNGETYRGFLDYYGCWDLKILTASTQDHPPTLADTSYDVPMSYYTVIDAILRFMRPTGMMLAGGPRLSEARFEPADFSCRLEPQDFGAGPDGAIAELSGHERIARIGGLVSLLASIGMPEDQASALVEHL